MAAFVIMPRQGQSVESCVLGKWHKVKGDAVTEGDLLFTYETDKSTFDEYAGQSGALLDIFFEEGDDVPCLANVCVLGAPGEDISQLMQTSPADAAKTAEAAINTPISTDVKPTALPDTHTEPSAEKIKISPRAKNLAYRAGVDPRAATPTGPGGRVITRDVEALLNAASETRDTPDDLSLQKTVETPAAAQKTAGPQPDKPSPEAAAAAFTFAKHSNIRKTIARSMHASLQNTAQLTLNAALDASDIINFRKNIKAKSEALGLPGVTVGDIALFAVSRVLLGHPPLNAHYADDGLKLFSDVHLGVAVDTDRGLMVPTLFNANRMNLKQISAETRRAAAACKAGDISPDELTGGTFTVTNLGALGVEGFTPVINPPQTAILGVCAITERIKTIDGQLKPYPAMNLSLTFDHRAVDGAPAARFLAGLIQYLENFSLYAALD